MAAVRADAAAIRSLPHGVVAVVRRDDGRYLLIRRAEQSSFAGYWCPVSGRVEEGESHAETAVREAREEVGIEVRALRKIHEAPAASGRFLLHWWLCELVAGEPRVAAADEVDDVAWVRTAEVHTLGLHFTVDVELMARLDIEA
jgi:8-oxo-dGTP diphosphatase